MQQKRVFWCVMLGILFLCSMIPACVNPHTADVEQAKSLIDSANSRMSVLSSKNMTTVAVREIRANASAAKSDLSEARKILEKIPRNELNPQDQAEMNAVMSLIGVYIDMMDTIGGPFADFVEEVQTVMNSGDPETVAQAGVMMKQDLQEVRLAFGNMSTRINAIDDTGLSQKTKGDLIYLKSMANSISADIDKASNQLAGACIRKCAGGEVLGQDCQCHPACGKFYCSAEAVCCKNVCYISPGANYKINMDTCYYS